MHFFLYLKGNDLDLIVKIVSWCYKCHCEGFELDIDFILDRRVSEQMSFCAQFKALIGNKMKRKKQELDIEITFVDFGS